MKKTTLRKIARKIATWLFWISIWTIVIGVFLLSVLGQMP